MNTIKALSVVGLSVLLITGCSNAKKPIPQPEESKQSTENNTNLSEEIAKLRSEKDTLQKQLDSSGDHSTLNQKIAEKDSEITKLVEEKNHLQSLLEDARTNIASLNDKILLKENEIKNLLDDPKSGNPDSQAELKKLQEETANLKSLLKQATDDLSKIQGNHVIPSSSNAALYDFYLSVQSRNHLQNFFYSIQSKNKTICVEILEQPNAILCGSPDRTTMNHYFNRTMIYVEGTKASDLSYNPGDLISHGSDLDKLNNLVSGHNLPLASFNSAYELYDQKCKVGDQSMCLNDDEIEFKQNVVDVMNDRKDEKSIIIAFSIASTNGGPIDWARLKTINHESLHAQYMLNDKFKNIIDDYWKNKMNADQRIAITSCLQSSYNTTNNEYLVINEFMAYVLDSDAASENECKKTHFDPHKQPLTDFLKDNSLQPIRVPTEVLSVKESTKD
jgi:hypothetical protein